MRLCLDRLIVGLLRVVLQSALKLPGGDSDLAVVVSVITVRENVDIRLGRRNHGDSVAQAAAAAKDVHMLCLLDGLVNAVRACVGHQADHASTALYSERKWRRTIQRAGGRVEAARAAEPARCADAPDVEPIAPAYQLVAASARAATARRRAGHRWRIV